MQIISIGENINEMIKPDTLPWRHVPTGYVLWVLFFQDIF